MRCSRCTTRTYRPHLIDLMVARAYPKRFEVTPFRIRRVLRIIFQTTRRGRRLLTSLSILYAFYYSPFGSYRQFVDPALYSVLGGYVTVPAPSGGTAQSSGDARVVNGSGNTRVEPRQPPVVVGRTSEGSTADSSGPPVLLRPLEGHHPRLVAAAPRRPVIPVGVEARRQRCHAESPGGVAGRPREPSARPHSSTG